MMLVLTITLMCLVAVANSNEVGEDFHLDNGDFIGARFSKEANDATNVDEDYLHHDCKTIKPYTLKNLEKEPWWDSERAKLYFPLKGARNRRERKYYPYVKYNSAYGMLMLGTEKFYDESMLRGCYLIRYLFAENQHMRMLARKQGFYNSGYQGGWCCPPQMGDMGLSCTCGGKATSGGKEKFPILGKGAPSHEMAHKFIRGILKKLVKTGDLKLPKFQDDENWKYTTPVADKSGRKCLKKWIDKQTKNNLFAFLWNGQKQDLLHDPPGTIFSHCDGETMDHYFIYSGQERWLFGGTDEQKKLKREGLKKRSPNLYNLMEQVWPCGNNYIPVCKDAMYDFKLGLAQRFIIGKANPNDKTKMICEDIDKAEVSQSEVPTKYKVPDKDLSSEGHCLNVAGRLRYTTARNMKSESKNVFKPFLQQNKEESWYLLRCCAKTAKFT